MENRKNPTAKEKCSLHTENGKEINPELYDFPRDSITLFYTSKRKRTFIMIRSPGTPLIQTDERNKETQIRFMNAARFSP